MTRTNQLEKMILRLTAQRNCLDLAAEMIAGLPGPVLEFGLGKGRTYDYLRNRLSEREIFVFERDIHCPPDCIPADGHLLLGDVRDTVPGALARIGEPAALAHFDIGTHDRAADAPLITWLTLAVTPLVRVGGVVVTDREMANPRWAELSLPPGTSDGYHFVYRVER
ncbi:MAG: class I SAM-dependent methyltransferase [Alphaproteobacteria bacterium]